MSMFRFSSSWSNPRSAVLVAGLLLCTLLSSVASTAWAASATNGQALYSSARCSNCHGSTPAVNTAKIWNGVNAQTTKSAFGTGGVMAGYMPSMTGGTTLVDSDFNDLAVYIAGVRGVTATCIGGSCTTVTPAPAVSLSSTAAQAFGNVTTGTTSTAHSITLTNSGTAALSITSISTNNAVFAVNHTCGTSVAAGASCTINLTYAPQAVGAASGTLSITTNASTSPNTVALSGTGVAPVVTAPAVSLSTAAQTFGSVTTGTTSPAQAITLTNTGTAALSITSISTNNAAFTVSHACGTSLVATGSCVISVRFAPTLTGAATATLSVVTNASTSPNTVALSGTGAAPVVTAPAVSLSPAVGLNFSGTVGTPTAAQTVTLTNSGTAALAINSITATSTAFAVTHTCGTSVAVGASCAIHIVFTPAVTGQTPAQLVIATNASTVANSVAMVGTGMAVNTPMAVLHWDSSAPFSFGNSVAVGTSLVHTFTLSNAGTAPATVVLPALSGADLTEFSLSGPCLVAGGLTLAPATICQVTLTFAPTTAGAKSVTLGLTAQGGTLPTAIVLSGTALGSSTRPSGGVVSGGTSSATTSSGGGCTLGSADQPLDPLWLALLAGAALTLRRRRASFPV